MKVIANALSRQTWVSISKTKALWLCIAITLSVMVLELLVGSITNSLMLFSDGLHMLSHAASLGITLMAIYIAKRRGNEKVETIAALINGVGLLFFTGFILAESFERLASPEAIVLQNILLVAILGLAVNLTTAFILGASGVEDLNTKSAFMHMLADTFSSVAIITGALIIYETEWFWVDAILSAVIAVVVGKWSWGLIRDAVNELSA